MPDLLPLPDEGPHSAGAWKSRIQAAEEKRDLQKPDWDAHITDYLVKIPSAPKTDTVVVPKHFSLIEQKKPQLFFQTPEVALKKKRDDYAEAAFLFQPVLNHYLGDDGVDAKATMNEVTFDVLVTGLMCSKIGYENVSDGEKPMVVGQEPVPGPPQPGAVLGLAEPAPVMQPVVEMVPNVIWERYFWERISPAKVLIPETFHGSVYDKAPWLGFEFVVDRATAIRQYQLPPDFDAGHAADEHRLGPEQAKRETKDDQVRGWEIWYKAAYFDESVRHPEQFRQIVFLDGIPEPVVHRNSPYQTLTPEGKLTGMKGNPVHVGALRYVSDSAYPPADCATTKNLVGELSRFRSTMILQRDRSIPMRAADRNRLTPEAQAALERGEWQSVFMLDGPPEGVLAEVARAQYPRENYTANDYCDRDISEAWAMGPNQRGMDTTESKTATELKIMEQSASVRMQAEQAAVLTYFARGAEKLGALIQMFADEEDYIEIEGPDGAKRLAPWDKTRIAGEFIYQVKPDGAQHVDVAAAQRRELDLYNFAAKDPAVNRIELLKSLMQAFGKDPSKLIAPPQPKGPDPTSVSLRVAATDLDPTLPHFELTLSLLAQTGFKIDPQAVAMAKQKAALQSQILTAAGIAAPGPGAGTPQGQARPNTEHGGMADKTELVNKHQMQKTGGTQGIGV